MADNDIFNNYKEVDREFIHMPIWIQIIKGLAFSGVIVCYIVFQGPELAYAIYLPLDILLEIVLFVYRLVEGWLDRRRKQRE